MRQADHNLVRIKRQPKPNTRPPHHPAKIKTKEFGVTRTTFGRPWTVEQDIQDRSTDREDVPRGITMATYSDVTNLATPELKTAKGLLRSYVAVWPNIEAPHTRFASLMK